MFDENSFKDIPSIDFARYYNVMRENNEAKIKEEYLAINAFSESLEKTCIASRASQKLNRYSNISPFDENRVVLDADEFENDYINASFVDVSSNFVLSILIKYETTYFISILIFYRVTMRIVNISQRKDLYQRRLTISGG